MTLINYQDGRTRKVHVAIHGDSGFVHCGVISFNSAQKCGDFTYDEHYAGPALDPVNLDFRRSGQRRFEINPVTNRDLVHRVFIDYLPGPWGLQVLETEYPGLRQMLAVEKLHWFGSRTVGSLAFYVEHLADEHPVRGIDILERIRLQSVDLYMRQIERMSFAELGGRAIALEGLAAHGGARPKCLFEDRYGGHWLVKFNIATDPYNYARVEHAASVLARRCGIDTVDTLALELGNREDVLFVRRFDRAEDRRPHKISAFSMMREDIVRTQSEGDYRMLFDLLERISCDPGREQAELFRRMLFNIAIANTDDHLKNFELLLDHQDNCYRLSPAYDLTVDPYPNPRVTSVFGLTRPTLDDETIEHVLKQLPMDRNAAYEIRDTIRAELAGWRQTLVNAGVSARDVGKLQNAFDRSLGADRNRAPTMRPR